MAGDANKVSFLTEAMEDCSAAHVFIPMDYSAADVRGYQNSFGATIAEALKKSGIKKVVNLSTIGAELPAGTGTVLGLHDQEQRLNRIPDIDVVHLRAGYFMENLMLNIPTIIGCKEFYDVIPGNLPIMMIATQDVAARAAHLLMNPEEIEGTRVEYLLGERDISFDEAAEILGLAIKIPQLRYVELFEEEMKDRLMEAGVPKDWAHCAIEVALSFSSGALAGAITRNKENTTSTTLEEFAQTSFLSEYQQMLKAEMKRRKCSPQGELPPQWL